MNAPGEHSGGSHPAGETAKLSDRHASVVGFERVALGIGLTDLNTVFIDANPALCEFYGRRWDEVVGHSPYEFMDPDDAERAAAPVVELMAGRRQSCTFEARAVRPDGSLVWGRISLSMVRDEAGRDAYLFGQLEDITERKRAVEALEYRTLHDGLTGLPNRLLFAECLGRVLDRRDRDVVAVLLIDLDEFKVINDALGHEIGDRVLVEIGRRLRASARRADVVGRFGGDEFVVLCEVGNAREVDLIAQRLLACIVEPVEVGDVRLMVAASIGIAFSAPDSTTSSLVRDADTAMYRAKANGRNRAATFTRSMGRAASTRLREGLALRHALDHDQLTLAYQPVVRIGDESPAGVEALVRWDDPERGPVSPDEFIAFAELSGEIFRIGDFVTRVALRDIERIRRELPGAQDLTVAINLSSRQFADPHLPALIVDALGHAGLPAEALRLELTETVVMRDVETALAVIGRLRDLGLHVDVDDFGTGYSSLSYLKRLPVSTLKIDRSFVEGLGSDANDDAIVASIIALAHTLGLTVIAEGVETRTQLDELRRLGCEYGQGYLWSAPLDVDALAAWILRRPTKVEPR